MQPLPHCRRLFPYRIVFKLFVTCTNWIFITTPFTDVYLLYMCPGDPELLLSQEPFYPCPCVLYLGALPYKNNTYIYRSLPF